MQEHTFDYLKYIQPSHAAEMFPDSNLSIENVVCMPKFFICLSRINVTDSFSSLSSTVNISVIGKGVWQ